MKNMHDMMFDYVRTPGLGGKRPGAGHESSPMVLTPRQGFSIPTIRLESQNGCLGQNLT